jgi:heptosyltransferase-2
MTSHKQRISFSSLKTDCRFFRGDIPCKPHKQFGVHCFDEKGNVCSHYQQTKENILIIKLGAIGDVIRTTPLLHLFKKKFPNAKIWWLTLTPEVIPSFVDVVLKWNHASLITLQQVPFSRIYNYDKDREASALASSLSAKKKFGFVLKNGVPSPANKFSEAKFLTGVFDDVNKANTKSYLEELFEIAGEKFKGEKYILDNFANDGYQWNLLYDSVGAKGKKIIGLNTGCGGRWTSRLWANENWIALAKKLKKTGYVPLLLGGEQEHDKNLLLAKKSDALYLGHFPLKQFINLVDKCNLVVTAVTMALHITLALEKKIVLFNNIFNKHEFELYGLGEILEPDFDCDCFFSPVCPNNCMQYLSVDTVYDSVLRLINFKTQKSNFQ